jgi:hypothetical protein
MAKDPAFLFYPGDYLRDTQCLSEKAQVAYDRIMCEHMRNICKDVSKIGITKDKLNFFTKRLNEDEKSDLMSVLVKTGEIFQIEWVALSICKRKNYSDNRAENRRGKKSKDMKTYVSHMENANENVNDIVLKGGVGENGLCYDIEKYLLAHPKDFQAVASSSHRLPDEVKNSLTKYHLFLQKKEDYPKKPLPLISGFKLWLMNEKSNKNGITPKSELESVGKKFTSD